MPINLPFYIPVLFILTTILTAIFLIAAVSKNNSTKIKRLVITLIILWLSAQALLAYKNFYLVVDSVPPRVVLAIAPPLLAIFLLFITKRGKKFIDSLPIKILTQLHVVRIFVEIILFWLFLYKTVPQIMTFEGKNFDILAGISAPLIVFFGFRKHKLSNKSIVLWNVIALILLLNIVVTAVLSAPFKIQQFGFEQPNIAILYFPFVWLPCFIVPVVLFSHLVSIRQLSRK